MEDSPPLTPDGPQAQILLSGWHDWVSLSEARFLISTTLPSSISAVDLRSATLSAVDDLLRRGLVVAGDLTPDFEAWLLDAASSSRRIADVWTDPEARLLPGDVCWLANTTAGDAESDRLHHNRPPT